MELFAGVLYALSMMGGYLKKSGVAFLAFVLLLSGMESKSYASFLPVRYRSFSSDQVSRQALAVTLSSFFKNSTFPGRSGVRVVRLWRDGQVHYEKTKDTARLYMDPSYRRLVGQKKLKAILTTLYREGWRDKAGMRDLLIRLEYDPELLELVDILGSHTLIKVIPYVGTFANMAQAAYLISGKPWLIPLMFTTGIMRTILTVWISRTRYPLVLAIGILPIIGNFAAAVQMRLHQEAWSEVIFEATLLSWFKKIRKMATGMVLWSLNHVHTFILAVASSLPHNVQANIRVAHAIERLEASVMTPSLRISSYKRFEKKVSRNVKWVARIIASVFLPGLFVCAVVLAFKKSIIFRIAVAALVVGALIRRRLSRFYPPSNTTTVLRNRDLIPGLTSLLDIRDTPVVSPDGRFLLVLVRHDDRLRVLCLDRDPKTGQLSNGRFLDVYKEGYLLGTPTFSADGHAMFFVLDERHKGRGVYQIPFDPDGKHAAPPSITRLWARGDSIPGLIGERFSIEGSVMALPGGSEAWVMNRQQNGDLALLAIPWNAHRRVIEGRARIIAADGERVNGHTVKFWQRVNSHAAITTDGQLVALMIKDELGRSGILMVPYSQKTRGLRRDRRGGLFIERWMAINGRSYYGDVGVAQPLNNAQWGPYFIPGSKNFMLISMQGSLYETGQDDDPFLFPTEQVLLFHFKNGTKAFRDLLRLSLPSRFARQAA